MQMDGESLENLIKAGEVAIQQVNNRKASLETQLKSHCHCNTDIHCVCLSNCDIQFAEQLKKNKKDDIIEIYEQNENYLSKKDNFCSEEREDLNIHSNINDGGLEIDNESISNSQRSADQTLSYLSSQSSDGSLGLPESFLMSLKNDCATIFSLSHSMFSSLTNANRLLMQLITNQFSDSNFEQHFLEEIKLCEKNCHDNKAVLNDCGRNISQHIAQLNDAYMNTTEQKSELKELKAVCNDVLQLTKDLLDKNGLQHLAPTIQLGKLSNARLLDEIKLCLTILSGEALNKHLLQGEANLKEAFTTNDHLKKEISVLQAELCKVKDSKYRKMSSLQIQLEKSAKDQEEIKCQLQELEHERNSMEDSYRLQLEDAEKAATKLRHQLVNVEQETKERIAAISLEDRDISDKDKVMESELSGLKEKLKMQEQQITELIEDRKKADELYRNQEKKLSEQINLLKKSNNDSTDQHKTLNATIKRQQEELEEQKKKIDDIKDQSFSLKESLQQLRVSHSEELQEYQQKINDKNDEICEKDSKIRSLEVNLMQSKTELELEKQRSLTLSGETDILSKQIDRLHEKMKTLMNFCPRDFRLQSLTAGASVENDNSSSFKIDRLLEESHEREEQLRMLLNQKDEEIKSMHDSISQEITSKNQELEGLSISVETLESEMKDILESMNYSAHLFDATHRTKDFVDSRSKQIEHLELQVKRLSSGSKVNCEDQSEIIESLRSQLKEAKKALRVAREEARKERIEAAKLQQQVSLLKIDIESTKENYKTGLLLCNSSGSSSNLQGDDVCSVCSDKNLSSSSSFHEKLETKDSS